MDRPMDPINRRRFLRWLGGGILLGGAAALGLQACGREATGVPLSPAAILPTGRPGWSWEVRWIAGTPRADPASWRLTLDGMVREQRALTLEEIRALPAVTLRMRMKCVECWSAPAEWTGVAGQDLLALVEPLPEAGHVTVHALDGYTSTLALEHLRQERVLFVYGMDGRELGREHGYPLRLIVPSRYGYKSVKAISRLEFGPGQDPGYWEQRGYDEDGTIQPGFDHPLDLGRGARQIQGGEITDY